MFKRNSFSIAYFCIASASGRPSSGPCPPEIIVGVLRLFPVKSIALLMRLASKGGTLSLIATKNDNEILITSWSIELKICA